MCQLGAGLRAFLFSPRPVLGSGSLSVRPSVSQSATQAAGESEKNAAEWIDEEGRGLGGVGERRERETQGGKRGG